METLKFNVVELTTKEQNEVEGGILDKVLAVAAIAGAIYGAGYALGQAYYHYTH